MGADAPASRVVVLDRDGTLVVDRHYLADPDGLEFLPGAIEGLRSMLAQGFRLVVVTNQSGVGRGLFSAQQLEQVHERLRALLQAEGVALAGLYACPHAPEAGCECRKPGVALLLRAARELGFDPAAAIVIGDKAADIELGRSVGATTMLVAAAPPAGGDDDGVRAAAEAAGADFVVSDLAGAARAIARLQPRAAGPGTRAAAPS